MEAYKKDLLYQTANDCYWQVDGEHNCVQCGNVGQVYYDYDDKTIICIDCVALTLEGYDDYNS